MSNPKEGYLMADDSKKLKNPNPFDPAAYRLGQSFAENVGVKKHITSVPVRKPHRHSFVRTRLDTEYRLSPAAIIEDSESREAYIVAPDIAVELSNEFNLVELFTAIDRQGGLSIWPVKLPGIDGRQNAWHTSMMAAAEMATKKWVRVVANMSVGAYDVFEATGNLPEPEWPELTFPRILEIAFRGRVIDSFDHPLLKRLRGEA
jgi:hypothetical protein